MGQLYHGSSISGTKKIEPKKSTHGIYVYATPHKELAIIFSSRCGDNLSYSLYRKDNNEPWQIVERIPNAFEVMFNNDASIYTVSDSTFRDINTGFAEVVSEVGVDVLKEEKILKLSDALKELEKAGIINIYTYPNRPIDIPADDSDLLMMELNRYKSKSREGELNKKSFRRLLYLHPNLFSLINESLIAEGIDVFSKDDIMEIFEDFLIRQILNPLQEQYIKSAFISISNSFPELIPQLEDKLSILDKNKKEIIEQILEHMSKVFPKISKDIIAQVKNNYINDRKSFSQLREELRQEINKMISQMELNSNDTSQDNKSVMR